MTITPDNVEKALRAMLYSSSPPAPSPLADLMVVTQLLSDPALPSSPLERTFALNRLLIDLLVDRLAHLRRVNGLPRLEPSASHQEAMRQIEQDGVADNQELLSASWLYYRYVRVDLSLSPDAFATQIGVDPRTLRLYHRHGISRLTENLLQREWQVRQTERKLRLLMLLPTIGTPRLYGRIELLDQIRALTAQAEPGHIHLTGESGVGKTALAHEVIRRMIDDDLLDDLIWLDDMTCVEEIRSELNTRGAPYTPRQYTSRFRVAVVIDHADELVDTRLDMLLRQIERAIVIVISRAPLRLYTIQSCIEVPPLSEADAKALICALDAANEDAEGSLMAHEIDLIWRQASGYPGRITKAVRIFYEELAAEQERQSAS